MVRDDTIRTDSIASGLAAEQKTAAAEPPPPAAGVRNPLLDLKPGQLQRAGYYATHNGDGVTVEQASEFVKTLD